MGQTHSSSANNQDQDGDVIMVDDSENNIGDANSLDFNGTTYASRRVRTQVSRTSSQDRAQFTTSTIEQAPQNGSQRVLRMTPARRRRQQLSSLYSFFPSTGTTTQTQTLSRPLNRHQRLHHNTIEDVSFAPRQTDAIAPSLLRRNRTRSSSYNGQETSTNSGITFSNSESTHNTLPTSETMFDIRRPRSSSVDAIVNGDLDGDMTRPNVRFSDRLRRSSTHRGSSTRQYSSSISLSSTSSSNSGSSTAGTQTDPLAGSPQRSRRRVTRISARRLFNFGRVLSIAAAATAASLVASQENAVIEAERAANEGHDGSFESFLAALQRRRREASSRSTNQLTAASSSSEERDSSIDNNTTGSQPSQPMSFFRLFRFGGSRSSLTQQNIPPETGANVTSSIPNVTSDTSSSNTPQMVPVIIIGIRSVQPRDDSNGNSPSSQNVDNSANLESRNNSSRSSRTRSSSTSSRASVRSTASTATQTPPARSWIIYVLGGTYPATHPILTTPSLFSDNPTYEDMMLLSSLIGPARPPTTTQSEIDASLPIALYNESIVTDLLGNAEKCQVCLCDYIADEEIRVLNCRHGFHKECIDKWLTEGSNKCPICRGVGVPPRESDTNNSGPIPTTSAGLDSMGPFF
ncbi:18930_t:CDS:2 [Rhizophagus irregularis]|nr:18930_t:CDS:2 [Rhizophagus irregularis]